MYTLYTHIVGKPLHVLLLLKFKSVEPVYINQKNKTYFIVKSMKILIKRYWAVNYQKQNFLDYCNYVK